MRLGSGKIDRASLAAMIAASRAGTRHVRCCIEGDAFCEWELHWQPDAVKPPGA